MRAPPPIPRDLLALMADLGPRWGKPGAMSVKDSVQLMVDRFTEVLAGSPREGIDETSDVAYGKDDARQVLDVHRPSGEGNAPSVIFVHGGAFTDGEKVRTPEIYGNVARYFARHGVIGINMEYRQAPEWGYPAGSADVGLAVAWARANIQRFGGDPARIFVMGQSAGGAHTGSWCYDRRLHGRDGPGVAGHIVISGRVRADNLPQNPNARKVEAYYGTDASRFEDVSPVNHAGRNSVPTFIAVAEYENPLIDVYCAELYWRLAAARGRAGRFMRLPGHNHTSMIAHFNTAEDRVGRAILEFISQPD
jgi:acetyl esterase